MPDGVRLQAEELGAEWRVSTWERGGNLRGKECIEGMLDEMIRSACHEEDSLVKIDADTVIMSGDELRCFAGRKDLIFWGSGSVEQRIYGCLYGMKAHAAQTGAGVCTGSGAVAGCPGRYRDRHQRF